MRENGQNERKDGMQVREHTEGARVGGQVGERETRERSVDDWLPEPPLGRTLLISGWVGYTLTNCLPARRRRARAEGDLSPLKGLRFCRTPLPLSFSHQDGALLVFRACSSSHSIILLFFLFSFSFALVLSCASAVPSRPCLVEAGTRLEDESLAKQQASSRSPTELARIQLAATSTLLFVE